VTADKTLPATQVLKPPVGTVPLAALVESASGFLEANAGRASALDAMAHVAVIDALADLRALGDYRCGLATGLKFLRTASSA